MLEATIAMAMTLRRYDFELQKDPKDIGMEMGATIHTAGGLPMKIKRRTPARVNVFDFARARLLRQAPCKCNTYPFNAVARNAPRVLSRERSRGASSSPSAARLSLASGLARRNPTASRSRRSRPAPHSPTRASTAGMGSSDRSEMIASREDMKRAKLDIGYRDFCAHLLIPLNECRRKSFYLPWKCGHERHVVREVSIQRVRATSIDASARASDARRARGGDGDRRDGGDGDRLSRLTASERTRARRDGRLTGIIVAFVRSRVGT